MGAVSAPNNTGDIEALAQQPGAGFGQHVGSIVDHKGFAESLPFLDGHGNDPTASASASEPFLVPPIAARHRDPVVQECVRRLVRLFECRASLRQPLSDRRGGLLLPAFPELLQRPGRKPRDGQPAIDRGPDFERRRSDGMEAIVRTLLVVIACTDWVTMEVMDPRGGFLSVARLAELACLPFRIAQAVDEEHRNRARHDRAERALRALRTAGVIAFTKQHRVLLPNGSYTSTGPALRKLAVGLFRKFGGHLLRIFEKRREKLKRRRQREEPKTGDLRVAAIVRALAQDQVPSYTGAPRGPDRSWKGATPQSVIDAVHDEHPSWEFAEILVEARRRFESGAAPS